MEDTKETYLQEFTQDICRTFPEYHPMIQRWGDMTLPKTINKIWDHLIQTTTPQIMHIMLKNEKLWESPEINTEFLPGIVFRVLWNAEISETTKESIWKYLQFPILYLTASPSTPPNEGEEKEQEPKIGFADFMNPEFFEKIKEKKIGKLAMEIMEECKEDLGEWSFPPDTPPQKILQEMLKRTMTGGSLSKISKKLEQVQDTEEGAEMMREAQEIFQQMDMSQIQQMMAQMGLGGRKSKMNTAGMQAKMAQQKSQMDTKARLRAKLAAKKAAAATCPPPTAPIITKISEEEQRKKDEELFAMFATEPETNSKKKKTGGPKKK